jgi:ribosomal protein L20A (L18A)
MSIQIEQQFFSSTSSVCKMKISVEFDIEIEKVFEILKEELTEEVLIELIKNKKS